jgi:hypothetical protein
VASISETHFFSPALLNPAKFGYSRARFFFTGERTPNTSAAELAGFIEGAKVGQSWWGSAASNPAAQVGLAGSNNGNNLSVARNIYRYQDQVSINRGGT